MSASRERKKRMELAAAGQSPKQLKAAEEKKRKKKNLITGIIALVLVLAVGIGCLYGLVIRPNAMPRNTVALRVGDHELSAVEFGYYYYDAVNTFYQNYGSYISYLMSDPSLPLDEQIYDEETGKSWADYFIDGAAENAKYDYAVYDEAVRNGYTLSAEGEQSIQDGLDSLEKSVKENGYRSLNQYFSNVYGKGSSKSSYRAYQRIRQTANEYASKIDAERTYTAEQISAKEAEHPEQYSNVNYRSYYVSSANYRDEADSFNSDDEEANAAADAAAMDAARDAAEKMAKDTKGNEEKYIEMAFELASAEAKASYEDPDATLRSNQKYENTSSDMVDWLFDSSRKEGDTTTIEDTSGAYVLYFLSLEDNDYPLVNVRQLLVESEVDEDIDGDGSIDTSSEEAMAAAKAEAEAIYAEWQAGEATEDSFGALADEKDPHSVDGGLYSNVYRGALNDEFDAWCFDPARKPGDTDILADPEGYRLVYFASNGDSYRETMIKNDLREEDYNDWSSALVEGYDYTYEDAGIAYLHKDLVLGSTAG